jgi:hypothetical protein
MSQISDGAIVSLECQGTIPRPDGNLFRFLDGLTETSNLQLSGATSGIFTGTHWQCSETPDGNFTFACAGAIAGARYLDGRTVDGTVGLAGDTLEPFSGTQWRVQEVAPDIVTLECLGRFQNPSFKFLDGRTIESNVGLVGDTNDPPHSGTKWRATFLARPNLSVTTTRNEEGANLHLRGSGFTSGDSVEISAEGIIGRTDHAPFALGFANVDGNSSFETFITIRFAEVQPNNPAVVIRATDHNGMSAVDTTAGFTE